MKHGRTVISGECPECGRKFELDVYRNADDKAFHRPGVLVIPMQLRSGLSLDGCVHMADYWARRG